MMIIIWMQSVFPKLTILVQWRDPKGKKEELLEKLVKVQNMHIEVQLLLLTKCVEFNLKIMGFKEDLALTITKNWTLMVKIIKLRKMPVLKHKIQISSTNQQSFQISQKKRHLLLHLLEIKQPNINNSQMVKYFLNSNKFLKVLEGKSRYIIKTLQYSDSMMVSYTQT